MIQPQRIRQLNRKPVRDGRYILYWMQAAQRADWNHALDYAIQTANQRRKPLPPVFVLTDYPQANLRHYTFMLEGLAQTQRDCAARGITLNIIIGSPEGVIAHLAKKADTVITDDGYLRIQRQWRKGVADAIDCPLVEIITNVVVPVETASDKENFSAGTLRPRIRRQLAAFLTPMNPITLHSTLRSTDSLKESICLDDIDKALKKMNIDNSVPLSIIFKGGSSEAQERLKTFITGKLDLYGLNRGDPSLDIQSHLSPYLHFGQISPLQIGLAVEQPDSPGKAAFLEELIVRRELAFNFVWYNPRYDRYDGLPHWALRTLNFHAKDKRPYRYTLEQLETAQTHDPAWNAAQMEMVITGKMHNYMRMYWGKKILEWMASPKDAFEQMLHLNNKYELDGRDPNSYAGVAWCLGKHDRAWGDRPIFGKIRYMNAAGLARKFDIQAYIDNINRMKSLS